MKASKHFVNAVSALALATAPVVAGGVAANLLAVQAAEAAVVRSISVQGNQRISETTIADFVNYQPGKNYTGADLDEAITRLFRTGLFSDVSVRVAGSTLVVVVDEQSVVNQVVFQGNRRVKDDRLQAATRLRARGAFDQETLNGDVDAILEAYSRVGRNDVDVTAEVVDLGENRVNVIYRINEGGKTKISSVSFVGNQAFSDRRLAGVVTTKRTSILAFLSTNDVYDEQRIAADEERLSRFYFNRGYADFRVLSSSADVDPETGNISIVFEVDEGERYNFGNIEIDSTVSGVDPEALRRAIASRAGKTYSAEDVEDTLLNVSTELASNGFPFAEVTPIGDRNFETQTIDVTYVVDQGTRAFIERIEVVGNTRSRDFVIRREFDLAEGDAFNQVMIRRAQRRLEALDFFERVNITTRPGSAPDRVIVVVEAIDKSTGEFGIGAGYATGSESNGITFEGSITERNFLGRGQTVRLAVGGGENSRTYDVAFTEPYFLGYRLSATFRAFRSTEEVDDDNYDTATQGASVRFGLPITDRLSGNFGYSYDEEEFTAQAGYNATKCGPAGAATPSVTAACVTPTTVIPLLGTTYVTSAVSYGLTYNSVDNRNDPREGIFATIQQEIAGVGGDAQYVRTTADARAFYTLSEDLDMVGFVRVGGGNITAFGNDPLRGVDHLTIGPRRLRGFDNNGIGPTDENGNQIGGTSYFNATAEAQFPIPAIPREFGLKGAVFADAATLFGSDVEGAQNTDMEWRASAGVSLIWQSPFAPLRFDYAVPLVKEDTDDERNFHFSISTAF